MTTKSFSIFLCQFKLFYVHGCSLIRCIFRLGSVKSISAPQGTGHHIEFCFMKFSNFDNKIQNTERKVLSKAVFEPNGERLLREPVDTESVLLSF